MAHLIRIRDGRVVGTHSGPAADSINVPDGETSERFDTVEEFEARLAELTPDLAEDASVEEFRQAVEAATSVADLKAALLGTSGPGAEPRRAPR